MNRTLVSIAGIPKGIETNIQTVSKVSEDVLETVSTIPDILDANVKVISAIPADLTSKANSLVEKTTNFPSHVQTEVNSTITRIQMDLEEKKKRIIAAAVLIKSIALFPYEASLKVISVLEIISSQINELRSELAGEITPEKAERLRQRALIRKAQLESRQSVVNTYDTTKKLVYDFFDGVENAIIAVQRGVEETKKTPEKLQRLSQAVSAKVEDIKQTPTKLSEFQKSLIKRLDAIKSIPSNVKRSVDGFQSKLRKSQAELVKAGAYLWRVITLEEAKTSISVTQRRLRDVQDSFNAVSRDIRDPQQYFQRVAKKNTAIKVLLALAGLTRDLAVGTYKMATTLANSTTTSKNDEYAKYLFSKKEGHSSFNSTFEFSPNVATSKPSREGAEGFTKLSNEHRDSKQSTEQVGSSSLESSTADIQASRAARESNKSVLNIPADTTITDPMSFEEWCNSDKSNANSSKRQQ